MEKLHGKRIAIIGAGAIGGAVIDRLVKGTGCRPGDITAVECDDKKRERMARDFGVKITADPAEAAGSDLIVIAVPPPVVADILAALHDRLGPGPVIVSFAAALPLDFLETLLPSGTAAVRVNPNAPSLVGAGYNPVAYGTQVSGEARALADAFLAVLGSSVQVSDAQMNLYTALTAVGPTYFLPVFDAMVAAGLNGGLSREFAIAAAVETARGTASMVSTRAESPEDLRLYTGLRPLDHGVARDAVKAAIDDAFARMGAVQEKITGA